MSADLSFAFAHCITTIAKGLRKVNTCKNVHAKQYIERYNEWTENIVSEEENSFLFQNGEPSPVISMEKNLSFMFACAKCKFLFQW